MNEIWRTGKFPEDWHKAVIIPIPKPGKDKTEATNYRPIALTSCICKTMERMINDRLVWFLESNNLISGNQAGFRKNYSTNDHLVRLESFIRDAFIKKEHCVAIFFDLEKAYDTTWKYGMMKYLHSIGLRGRLPNFISNFLSDRSFNVRIGSTLSDTFEQDRESHKGVSYHLLYLISKLITLLNVLMILTLLCMLMISVSFINRKIWRIENSDSKDVSMK